MSVILVTEFTKLTLILLSLTMFLFLYSCFPFLSSLLALRIHTSLALGTIFRCPDLTGRSFPGRVG